MAVFFPVLACNAATEGSLIPMSAHIAGSAWLLHPAIRPLDPSSILITDQTSFHSTSLLM